VGAFILVITHRAAMLRALQMNAPRFVILERSEESMGWITLWGDGPPVDSSAALRLTMLLDDVGCSFGGTMHRRSDALGSQNDNAFFRGHRTAEQQPASSVRSLGKGYTGIFR
jgi:hypothetical protein